MSFETNGAFHPQSLTRFNKLCYKLHSRNTKRLQVTVMMKVGIPTQTVGVFLFFCSKSLFSCLLIDQRLACLCRKQWTVVVNSVFGYSMLTILLCHIDRLDSVSKGRQEVKCHLWLLICKILKAAVLFNPTFHITKMRYYRSNALQALLQADLGIAVEREFIALSTF